MKSLTLLWLVLTGALAALAQPDANSTTVTSSRSLSIPPDQMVFRVTVAGPLTSTLEDAAGQLQSLGLTASFSLLAAGANTPTPTIVRPGGVNGASPPPVDSLFWTFLLGVPFAKANATITALTALQPALAQKSPAWFLTFSPSGTQTSSAARPSCPLADLLADARRQAQNLANAAQVSLGQVLAMSGVSSVCTMTVKFGLTR